MNEEQRQLIKKLRSLDEDAALEWLKGVYPAENTEASGVAVWLIPHRSWSKKNQIELLNCYCLEPERPFLVFPFLQFMQIGLFLKLIRPHIPYKSEKIELWLYRFRSAIKNKKLTDADSERVHQFLSEFGSNDESL